MSEEFYSFESFSPAVMPGLAKRFVEKAYKKLADHSLVAATSETLMIIDYHVRVELERKWHERDLVPEAVDISYSENGRTLNINGWLCTPERAKQIINKSTYLIEKENDRRNREDDFLQETANEFEGDLEILNNCSPAFRRLIKKSLDTHSRELSNTVARALSKIIEVEE